MYIWSNDEMYDETFEIVTPAIRKHENSVTYKKLITGRLIIVF